MAILPDPILPKKAKISKNLQNPKSSAENPTLKLFSAHLHHYNQTDGFDPEWFPEASRSLYDVIQLYKEVQKNVPIDTPRMRVLS